MQAQPAELLDSAAAVRRLSAESADQHRPVHIRGVVTFFSEHLYSRFIQDQTAGIYLNTSTNTPSLEPGQLVDVVGTTSPGEYAPIVDPLRITVLGRTNLPPAKTVTFDQLASGREDSQFVEIVGIVRSVRLDEVSQFHAIELVSGGGRLTVYARALPVGVTADLVDTTLRVRGVCSTQFNRQRQLFAIRLMVPRAEDLAIETPAAADPFAVPTRSITSLLQFAPQGTYGHRLKVEGAVVHQQPGTALYIQERNHGLRILTQQTNRLEIGDRVEVLGFSAQGEYTPVLEDAVFRRTRHDAPPVPARIDSDAALSGSYDCRLVQLDATVLDRVRQSREQFLVLESSGFIFHALLADSEAQDALGALEKGSRILVTGICLIEPGNWQAGNRWRARSFRLLLRSANDVTILAAPPWWTLQKLLWIVGMLALVVLGAFMWVGILRRRVQKQTEIIRQQLQVEASLKERYVNLFENANDMVFTHDATGCITSINQSGERLLQRNREALLAMNLLELVAEDQRPAARHWLEQVVHGAELPTAEWDFINASGQRLKLEISSRLLDHNDHQVEIESIARDISERRRLERELLEISNREQRRIGHDLHDGVCQQLAGIAYLVDILGDQLQEKGAPQAADAERIVGLINEATVQARGVARGLFPVRLEENGLVSALEELADSACSRFRIACAFECGTPMSPAVDNETALHLYYIALEAIVNAVKHGGASTVEIVLRPDGERCRLSVRDNGTGFDSHYQSSTGMGIRIMRYRAKVIGATLDLNSTPGTGTEIACVFYPANREAL